MPTIPQLKQQKAQAYQQADQSGDAISPQQWGHVVGLMQHAFAKEDPQANPQTAQIMQQLSSMLAGNRPMSFQEMDQYHDALAAIDEPAAAGLVQIIDKALASMGAANPNLKGAIPANQQIRVRESLAKMLKAALSYKELNGTDILSAMKQVIAQQGMEGLPNDDRKMIQNMLLTGDSSQFISALNNDAGGQDGQTNQLEPVSQR